MEKSNIDKIIEIVQASKELEPSFFREVIKRYKMDSFDIIFKAGFFSFSEIPQSMNGQFREWNVLSYYLKPYIMQYPDNNRIIEIKQIILTSSRTNNLTTCRQLMDIILLLCKYIDYDIISALTLLIERDDSLWFLLIDIYKKTIERDKTLSIDLLHLLINKVNEENHTYILGKYDEIFSCIIAEYWQIICEALLGRLLKELYHGEIAVQRNNSYSIKIKGDTFTVFKDGAIIDSGNFMGDIFSNINRINNKVNDNSISTELYLNLFNEDSFYSIFDVNAVYSVSECIGELLKKIIEQPFFDEEFCRRLINNQYFYIIKLGLYAISKNIRCRNIMIEGIRDNERIWEFILRDHIFAGELKLILPIFNEENSNDIVQKNIFYAINKGSTFELLDKEYGDYFCQSRYRELRHIPFFKEKHNQLYNRTKIDYQLSPALGVTRVEASIEEFPLSLDYLASLRNEDCISRLNEFKEETAVSLPFPTRYSYKAGGKILGQIICKDPNKFFEDYTSYSNLRLVYISEVISALESLYRENKSSFNFEKTVDFFRLYIDKNLYRTHRETYHNQKYSSIGYIKSIYRLLTVTISEMDNKQKSQVVISLLNTVRILDTNQMIVEDSETEYESLSMRLVNSLWALTLDLVLTVTHKLSSNEGNHQHWESYAKDYFDEYKKKHPTDFYLILGHNLDYLLYLDSSWATELIESLAGVEWEHALSGYFLGSRVNNETFTVLADNIQKALNYDFSDAEVMKRIPLFISLAYLENFDNKMLYMIIGNWKHEQIKKVIWQLASSDTSKNPSYRDHIITAWKHIIDCYFKENQDQDHKENIKLYHKSCSIIRAFHDYEDDLIDFLIRFLNKYPINENELYDSDPSWIIRYIENGIEHGEDHLDRVAIALLKQLAPEYPYPSIIKLLDYLKVKNLSIDIEAICTEYLAKGHGRSPILSYIQDMK